MSVENCTFHSFKLKGKWYSTGRGFLHPDFAKTFNDKGLRNLISRENDGCFPGLVGPGDEFNLVVIPDQDHPNGYPFLLLV